MVKGESGLLTFVLTRDQKPTQPDPVQGFSLLAGLAGGGRSKRAYADSWSDYSDTEFSAETLSVAHR
jgi:hypothetical protein